MSTSTDIDHFGLDTTAIVRDIWDAASNGDHKSSPLDAAGVQGQAWTVLLSRLLPSAQPLSILDVGCGSGFLAFTLAALGHTVTGLDVSPGMLRVCRAEAERARVDDLQLVEGAAEHPPADLGPFDVVISRDLLWTLPRPENALNAWFDLVRPGGKILGIDALRSEELVRATTGQRYPAEVLDALPLLHARDLDPIENLWRRSGLDEVMVEELCWIDAVVHSEAPVHLRPMTRRLGYYLVEGIRPAR
ncbi:class I SAM-dependent methyltransferase [Actinopolymorpha pittospori]|uniref:SAM-dependent methyltransferase n=1 Tax=Actinopolymorpha pittospori TaxID=648752 RepID=A0A927MNE8_9ACTN|nr:class I SAM-dependent methyltransferase [Actinopolymorpha pittospori]MBE1603905.1 SAM-dependent methyltransferase [Actinopolymorpha pittospori]